MQQQKIVQGYIIDTTQILGQGAQGTVVKGVRQSDKLGVAVKMIAKQQFANKSDLEKQAQYKNIQREIAIQKNLNHVNIIKMYDVYETKNNVYMIMELGDQTLEQYLLKTEFTQDKLISFMKSIFEAFLYLTEVEITNEYQGGKPYIGICHLDLKPKNILMVNDIPKISDFGLSVQLNLENPQSEIESDDPKFFQTNRFYLCKGTYKYMSYQQLECTPIERLELHDVWSAGIIFYEIIYKRHPYYSSELNGVKLNHQQINSISVKKMIDNNLPFSYSLTNYHESLILLIKNMLMKDYNKRFTWKQCYQYLSDNLLNKLL